MIDLTKTYKLRNEAYYKLVSQPRMKLCSASEPVGAYVLEAEWEYTYTGGGRSTQVWTAEGRYFCYARSPHDWDLVEVETPTVILDPARKYRLRDPSVYEVLNPIAVGQDLASRFPITAQLRHRTTGDTYWETWTADGHFTTLSDADSMDLVEVKAAKPAWHE